jgi:hypothetical protein
MPLVVAFLLWSCSLFDDVVETGYVLRGLGFASDTTAILLKHHCEQIEQSCGFSVCDRTDYSYLELQLVDVRFKKVYWTSMIRHPSKNGYEFYARQWDDSTMIISSSRLEYSLWTIGSPKPHKITLNWNTEKEDLFNRNWLRWENDSILVGGNYIIDTKTRTMNSRETIGCINWWGEIAGGGCLINDRESCRFSLLSENGDTLSGVAYFNKCEEASGSLFTSSIHANRYFIRVSSPAKRGSYYYYWPADDAYFRYDEEGNIAQEPSFWVGYRRNVEFSALEFVDSTGNTVRY